MSIDALFRPTFADLRAEIERRAAQRAPDDEIAALVDQFFTLGAEGMAPLVEYDGTVTWLYRDAAADHVSVVGDILGYDTERTRMARLQGCDLFFLTAQIPLDARIEYLFAVDHPRPSVPCSAAWEEWLLHCKADPLNPNKILETAPMRAFSVLEMPNASPVAELDHVDDVPFGSVGFHIIGNTAHNVWRRVWVYLPPEYDARARRYPTLYLNDGEAYMLAARVPQILDVLLAQGDIVPTIVVFVEGRHNRGEEHEIDHDLIAFLADYVAPWIDTHYATSSDPAERVIGGASLGATLSLYAALERPDVFGGALAQSPAVSALAAQTPEYLLRNTERGFASPRCYVDVGRYEPPARIEAVQSFCNALLLGGAAVSYQDIAGDHSYISWRASLAAALRFHFGAAAFPTKL